MRNSRRTALSGESSPCRTVTTKESPRKIMSSPEETASPSGSYVTGLRTANSESSYTSSLGR
jgi:hypothetical protein